MDFQKTNLRIHVPSASIFDRTVGFPNQRNVRFLTLWWQPCEDEAMVSDGLGTFTGFWPGYLAYVQHRAVHP